MTTFTVPTFTIPINALDESFTGTRRTLRIESIYLPIVNNVCPLIVDVIQVRLTQQGHTHTFESHTFTMTVDFTFEIKLKLRRSQRLTYIQKQVGICSAFLIHIENVLSRWQRDIPNV